MNESCDVEYCPWCGNKIYDYSPYYVCDHCLHKCEQETNERDEELAKKGIKLCLDCNKELPLNSSNRCPECIELHLFPKYTKQQDENRGPFNKYEQRIMEQYGVAPKYLHRFIS